MKLIALGRRKSVSPNDQKAAASVHDFCDGDDIHHGIVGFEEFCNRFRRCHIDFDKQQICSLEKGVASSHLAGSYRKIESLFDKGGIYITILLRRKKYKLKLDTEFKGGIAMTVRDAKSFEKERCVNYTAQSGEFAVYPNKWVAFGGDYYNSAIVVTKDVSRLGMGFIKGFNWIIDFDRREVFIQKNTLALDADNAFPSFQVSAITSGLALTSKVKTCREYSLGDIVKSVNGRQVTSENICEIKQMLNACMSWDKFDIQTETIEKK